MVSRTTRPSMLLVTALVIIHVYRPTRWSSMGYDGSTVIISGVGIGVY